MSPNTARSDEARRAIAAAKVVSAVAVVFLPTVAVLLGAGPSLLWAPPIAINIALALLFGSTLRAGREPMISRFARIERGGLEPDLARYTRVLTWIWTLFFLVMAALSATLAAMPSPKAWQWFTAIGNWLFVVALFVGEWMYRRLRFAHYRHASLLRLFSLVRARWRT